VVPVHFLYLIFTRTIVAGEMGYFHIFQRLGNSTTDSWALSTTHACSNVNWTCHIGLSGDGSVMGYGHSATENSEQVGNITLIQLRPSFKGSVTIQRQGGKSFGSRLQFR
jgi:hypothetical protein